MSSSSGFVGLPPGSIRAGAEIFPAAGIKSPEARSGEEEPVLDEIERARFARLVLPHMDAAYGLARWLTRDPAQAEEAVQEAYLRAFKYFGSFRGEDARPWILGVVRNACYHLLEGPEAATPFDEEAHGEDAVAAGTVLRFPVDPEAAAIQRAERELLQRCLRGLPADYREALVLRELHGCSYREIAQIADIPLGTVMSRLSRARRLLQRALAADPARRETGT
jgi:RNA polymerase sigma-70 factor (ECF subfamily)